MENKIVEEIKPNGLCGGVIRAIRMINDHYDKMIKPVYMLGYLVHNKFIVESLIQKGIILCLNDPLEEINKINSGTVIFTAHGISPFIKNEAIKKGLNIIDTTCVNVLKVHKAITKKINDNYKVYIIGKKEHPEVKSFLGIHTNVFMYSSDLVLPNKAFVINQTTLNYDELQTTFKAILTKYPTTIISDEICNATKLRQNAVKKEAKNYDLVIVVGDTLSNNCESLCGVARNTCLNVIKIETLNDINLYDLTAYKKIGVTAAASTPKAIVMEIIEALKTYDKNKLYQSSLKDEDYIKINE